MHLTSDYHSQFVLVGRACPGPGRGSCPGRHEQTAHGAKEGHRVATDADPGTE